MIASVRIPGLRDARGRFAEMSNFRLKEIQLLHAKQLASELENIYQDLAPHGQTGDFSRSISATAAWTGSGFRIDVSTEMGNLARWLREGTGIYGPTGQRITPTNAKALVFDWMGQHWVLASVAGMHPNPWEEEAAARAVPTAKIFGNRIGQQVMIELGDKK